jgi:multidrug efflux pump subunit AcrA (membrane-fusion protein)
MKRASILWFVVGLVVAGGASVVMNAWRARHEEPTPAGQAALYHCPMHPSYVSDKPGNCPICGMKLVSRAASPRPSPGERRILYYRSPMDPSVRSDKPAKDSMGMDFVPVYADEAQTVGGAVPGRTSLTLSPEKRQALGIRSEEIHHGRLTRALRTVGRVTVDERRLHHIHTKYDGYVEHLYVDFTGKYVERGDHLLSIYSPDLVATQQEYLLAYNAQKMAASGIPSVAQGTLDLLEATRQRLLLWDMRDEDIDALERAGKVSRTIDLHSDVAGYVTQKMAFHGMRVTPADTLFDIADLSQVWVLADVYESDLPLVRVGMMGELTVPYLPGKTWRGAVTYVGPTVEEKTRTVKVRIELRNEGQQLKPDMFADVHLQADLGTGLSVPQSAVIDSGGRKLVFVDRGEGSFEPREVQLGVQVGGGFQVLSGLADGERVVTSANFLLDSESSLRSALSDMATPAPKSPDPRH